MIRVATKKDYDILFDIWKSAVEATHDFLSEKDYNFYKSKIKSVYFCEVRLYAYTNDEGIIQAFLGVNENKLEMLFVHNSHRGKGIGKILLQFAINELGIKQVDVNEQNTQAVEFYKKHNFIEKYYSAMDYEGKPYPIIGMILK